MAVFNESAPANNMGSDEKRRLGRKGSRGSTAAHLTHPGRDRTAEGKLTNLWLRARHAIARTSHALTGGCSESFRTLLISLPASEDRRRALHSRMDTRAWRLELVEACFPPLRPSLSEEEWSIFHAMSDRLRPGQRGCFLSHRRAWLEALDASAEITIILEDDAVPVYRTMPRLPALPPDLDILYLHHFAQYIPTPSDVAAQCLRVPRLLVNPFDVYSINAVLASHCGRLHRAAMPASAYAITRCGAAKLLSTFEEVGNFFQWDSIMLRHAIDAEVYSRMLPLVQSNDISFYRGQRPENAASRMSTTRLNSHALYPPLFIHDHDAPSVKVNVSMS